MTLARTATLFGCATSCRFGQLLFFLCLALPIPADGHTSLISPNGGESLDVGSVFAIEWLVEVQHDTQNWDLWYSTTSNEGPWIDLAIDLPIGDPMAGAQHSFDWTIPDNPAAQAWVQVRQDNAEMDYFGVSSDPFSIVGATVACDFDGDGLCGVSDLNALLNEGPIAGGVSVTPGSNDQFDLDGNGTLNLDDRDQWLATAAGENGLGSPYKVGDANLDGSVDGQDFIAWNANKFTNTLRWDQGDLNGDGIADGGDFILWNASKFQSSDAVSANLLTNTVPEPTNLAPLVGCLVILIFSKRGHLATS